MNADVYEGEKRTRRGTPLCTVMGTCLLVGSVLSWSASGSEEIGGSPDDVYHRGVVMDESEMAQLRGGFNIAGMELDFGAELRSLIDDKVQLVTRLNFTRTGEPRVLSQTFEDLTGSAIRVGPDSGIRVTEVTPDNVNLSGLENFSGITLQDEQGFTAALHNISRNAILSGVISNASGKNIQQAIDVSVHLSNVGELRAAKQRAAIIDSFSGIIR
ncbi:hypothetical protein [Halomonas ramblicola]|uniref:hypothetical protein n=1 Tax=Halomonas ramblicola TaxID=747349 RepID=UPI0025B5FDB1|nr:hypothetical protein [Halomonas ramblicola]MDN3523260.1 hypothetical protein [Halomonas ramblicola]